MKSFRTRLPALLSALLLIGVGSNVHASTPAASLPGDSIYQLSIPLVDQDALSHDLASLRGKPRIISMFYSSCLYVCPLIIDTVRRTERALDDAERAQLGVLMVSIDSERDTPEKLKELATQRKVDTTRWSLARADSADVRTLAAVLGLQYRALPDGEFNHSSELILLDADGRIVARSNLLGKVDDSFVAAIRKTLGTAQ